MKTNKLNRRDFLAKSSIGLVGAGFAQGIYLKGDDSSESFDETRIKEYRVLGRTGFKVSDIGCGPVNISNENVLREILKAGVNFIDTAEFYSNGNNELMVGRAIKDFNRDSLFINTKIYVSENDTKDSIISRVRKCLERLDTNYLDGLMLWSAKSGKEIKNEIFHQAVDQLKNEGRVKYLGVSCHGASMGNEPEENMEQIIGTAVDDGRFDLVLFVYNYIQQEMGENILKACAQKNIGTTIMKTDPFGGAYLNITELVENYKKEGKAIPENYKAVYDKIIEKQLQAESYLEKYQVQDDNAKREVAVRFVLNHQSAHSVLITFRNFNDIMDYINLSGTRLTEKNVSFIDKLKETYGHLYCRHACGLCESKCPFEIPVNTIMRYNHYFMTQSREKYAIEKYYKLPGNKADRCSDCEGFCQQACPYGVPIHTLLSIAHRNLSLNMT